MLGAPRSGKMNTVLDSLCFSRCLPMSPRSLEGDSLGGDPCDPHFFELNEECGTRYEQISDGDSTHCYGILSNSDVGAPQIHHHVHATCLVTATFCDSLCHSVQRFVQA
jgi:hypothetical protein